jgi:hypothetical protein
MGVTTTGYHRVGNVTMRGSVGVEQQVVPGASVYVTLTSTGAAATIYSDPGLSISITGSVVTADTTGAYGYYIPQSYNVTENISSPSGSLLTITNVVQNGPLVASLTTTAAASDTVTLAGCLTTSHFSLQPTNSSAATMFTSTYVSTKSAGSFVVTHPSTSGATFDIIVTPY